MNRHVPGLALLATAAALFLSACGGGDSEPAAQEPATAAQGSAQTIEIDASDFAFTPSTIDIDAPGTYTFVVTNSGQSPHALEIDGQGSRKKRTRSRQAARQSSPSR